MKKEKIFLDKLKVTSFVTTLDKHISKTIRGGETQDLPYCNPNQSQNCSVTQCQSNECNSGQDSVLRACVATIAACPANGSTQCNVTVIGCSRIC